jgi:ATP-dependent DNA helicase RecQ
MAAESQASEEHKRIERSKLDALLGWCEVTTCRRQALLAYFGDVSTGDCGNCDVCLRPPATWDGTEAAQKALSCVYRTGQRFGAAHVVDVLRGQRNEKVLKFGHEALSTFGIGGEFSDTQWRSILRQLVVRGYLMVDHGRYGALTLTDASRGLLRGEVTLFLREDAARSSRRREKRTYTLELEDESFMDALRDLRKRIAEEAGVPPYVVFHDASLLEMVHSRPRNLADLLEVSGVGQAKLARYGQQFLDVILSFHPVAS